MKIQSYWIIFTSTVVPWNFKYYKQIAYCVLNKELWCKMIGVTLLIRLPELSLQFRASRLGMFETVFCRALWKTYWLDLLTLTLFHCLSRYILVEISFRKTLILDEIHRTSLAMYGWINVSMGYVLTWLALIFW